MNSKQAGMVILFDTVAKKQDTYKAQTLKFIILEKPQCLTDRTVTIIP